MHLNSDVGQHQMWAAQFYKFDKPRRWINSGGLGTMGFGLLRPWVCSSRTGRDGRLRHRRSEHSDVHPGALDHCKQYRSRSDREPQQQVYGMVRQWQQFFHGNRYYRVVHGRAARLRQARRELRHAGIKVGNRRRRAGAEGSIQA